METHTAGCFSLSLSSVGGDAHIAPRTANPVGREPMAARRAESHRHATILGAFGESAEEFIAELGQRYVNGITIKTDERTLGETARDGFYNALVSGIKKRIQSWLNVNRLQLPLHNLGSDSINSISQKGWNSQRTIQLEDTARAIFIPLSGTAFGACEERWLYL